MMKGFERNHLITKLVLIHAMLCWKGHKDVKFYYTSCFYSHNKAQS